MAEPIPIVIGSLYLNECPRQPYIPIYLIVGGVFGLMIAGLSCIGCTQRINNGPLSGFCTTWSSLTFLFLFCWLITGSVWIYSIYKPNYSKNATSPELYCNELLYLFAFWNTTVVYILLGLLFVVLCCIIPCCACGLGAALAYSVQK
ncbi:transmembrane protein 272-like [Betta splendens]|uniref:Transmembrane protein 272-like n=1 Tax=Betta splendens TaxID=158456 RepID=A0A9W2X9S2_BETSP|nr:transmembrane protein 272-like [Betta splendens]